MYVTSRRSRALVSILSVACGLGVAASAAHAQVEDIAEVTASGSGCPEGTWHWSMTEEKMYVYFDAYQVSTDATQLFDSKDCRISIRTAGLSPTRAVIDNVVVVGHVTLASGVSTELNLIATHEGAERGAPGLWQEDKPVDWDFGQTVINKNMQERIFTECDTSHVLLLDTRLDIQASPTAEPSLVNLNHREGGLWIRLLVEGC